MATSYLERQAQHWDAYGRAKCLTCGFLATGDGPNDVEIRLPERELGFRLNGAHLLPFCLRAAADLRSEMVAISGGVAAAGAVAQVIAAERNCPEWYPYTPGASPLWHHEEARMLHLENMRALREKEIAELNAQIQRDSKEIARQLHAVTVETSKFTTKWTYVAVGIAVVALVGVYLTYVFPGLGPSIGHIINPSWAPMPSPTP